MDTNHLILMMDSKSQKHLVPINLGQVKENKISVKN